MNSKYNDEDFFSAQVGKITTKELADKYGVSVNAIRKTLKRKGIRLVKKRIRIISPYGTKICESQVEVAQELKISPTMVGMILKGYDRCGVVKELNIKLEIIDN